MNDENLDPHMNYERAKIFLSENLKVHITIKRFIPNTENRIYYNGLITKVEKTYLIINDSKEGFKRIFYFDINEPIEEFTGGSV